MSAAGKESLRGGGAVGADPGSGVCTAADKELPERTVNLPRGCPSKRASESFLITLREQMWLRDCEILVQLQQRGKEGGWRRWARFLRVEEVGGLSRAVTYSHCELGLYLVNICASYIYLM